MHDNIIFYGVVVDANVSEDEMKVALIKRFSKYELGKYANDTNKLKFITSTSGFTRLTNLLISRLNIV